MYQITNNEIILAVRMAAKYNKERMNAEDIQSVVHEALAMAAMHYDAACGPFMAYARPYIQGAVMDALFEDLDSVRIAKSEREHLKLIRHAQEEYRMEYGCEPTCTELCELTGIEYDRVWALVHMHMSETRLDMPIGNEEDCETTLGDMLTDTEAKYSADIRELIEEGLNDKTERQREVYRRYFLYGENALDIAWAMDISRTEVFRLMK